MQSKLKFIQEIIDYVFEMNYWLYGGTIRDYILPKKKVMPNDIDIGVDDTDHALTCFKTYFEDKFTIDEIKEDELISYNKHTTIKMIHKEVNDEIMVDISEKKNIGSRLDFDVNGIYMLDNFTYKLVPVLNLLNIGDIMRKINRKKFNLINIYYPKESRNESNIVKNSLELIEFLKIMYRTTKMFKKGWRLENQTLTEIFKPCLIDNLGKSLNCTICSKELNDYALKLNCCEKQTCFECGLKFIKNKFYDQEIFCIFCHGDPFGWHTCKENIKSTINTDNDILIKI